MKNEQSESHDGLVDAVNDDHQLLKVRNDIRISKEKNQNQSYKMSRSALKWNIIDNADGNDCVAVEILDFNVRECIC